MAEVDYGYGDQNDYGYDDAGPDVGYGDASPDMGYGDAAPDLGYGNAPPDNHMEYGYGNATPDNMDYGYGDASPDPVPPPAPAEDKRPKRRCSVTKFSLATETPLTAASVINDLRMGLSIQPASSIAENFDCCGISTVTDETRSDDGMMTFTAPSPQPQTPSSAASTTAGQDAVPKKNGMISRIRRRLSIVS